MEKLNTITLSCALYSLFIISPAFSAQFDVMPAMKYWISNHLGSTPKFSDATSACAADVMQLNTIGGSWYYRYLNPRGQEYGANGKYEPGCIYDVLQVDHNLSYYYPNQFYQNWAERKFECVSNSYTLIGEKCTKAMGDSPIWQQNSCPAVRNPVIASKGIKYQSEADLYVSETLKLTRVFWPSNSISRGVPRFGTNWNDDYQKTITFALSNVAGVSNIVYALRSNSLMELFEADGSQWKSSPTNTNIINELKDSNGVRTGWRYTVDATGEVELYDTSGKLLSIADRAGLTQTLTYSDSSTPTTIAPIAGLLIRVTDHSGRQLNFSYDSLYRIKTMTNPAGDIYTYGYSTDGNNNLTSVTYPDGKVRTYHYENTTFKNALTGITDENGQRYATYSYDSQGRAISSEHANGAEKSTLVYNVDSSGNPTSTVVTDPGTGAVRTYNFTTILGVVKSTGQSQPGGAGCGPASSAMTYDANGNVASRTDFNGYKTTYVYDMTRDLETSRTEGLNSNGTARSETRTITTAWHSTWRLPIQIEEYSGATASGTPLKRTTYSYDTKGNVTQYTESDPVRNLSRTTTTTYTYSSSVPGLVLSKVVDGPRTDISDVTTYSYYPHDASCTASTAASTVTNLGCRGQLMSVTNALGQVTTYDRYNHHGQVEQMTDANGVVTTNTYDLRQRPLSRTVGGETTQLQYDGVGQVTQLTLPDNSQLHYTYDAAHRLTEVEDTLGNKVSYTLDTEGNRVAESRYDPQGTLTKTLTRSYDTLNRLQQVTGIE
jgi:YD repeat-containing protein